MAASGSGAVVKRLTLQADNLTARPFAEVSASIDQLIAKLGAQARAAQTGDVTAGELRTTLEKLGNAQTALAASDSLAQRYAKLSEEFETASAKAAAAGAALDALKAKQGTADASTKGFAKSLAAAERAAAGTAKTAAGVGTRLDELRGKLASAGADVEKLSEYETALAAANTKLNASYQAGKTALENFDAYARERRQQAEADRANAEQDREKAAKAAQAEAAAQQERDAALAESRRRYVALLKDLFDEQEAQQREADQANAALDAEQAARAAKITQEEVAARKAADAEKADSLRRYANMYAELLDEQEAQQKAAAKAAADAAKLAADAAAESSASQAKASKEAEQAAQRETAAAIKGVQDRIAAAERELSARTSIFTRMRQAQAASEVEAARQVAQAKGASAAQLQQIDADIAALARETAARNQLNKEVAESIAIRAKEAAEAREADEASAKHFSQSAKPKSATGEGGEGGDQAGGIGGISPYQLQLIGYRIKDVVDQLGAGSSVMRVFAQQGAAAADIFQNNLIPTLVRFLPLIASAGAAVAVFGLAVARVVQTEESVRRFTAQLSVNADAGRISAEAIVAQQRELEKLGASFDEAGESLRIFIGASIKPELFTQLGAAALNASRVFGGTMPEAAKKLTEAFTGNFQALAKLQEEYKFLTPAQEQQIKALYDVGKGADGASEAFGILSSKLETARGIVDGPLTKAFRELSNSWKTFLDSVGSTQVLTTFITDMRKVLDIVNGVGSAFDKLAGKSASGISGTPEEQLQANKAKAAELEAQRSALENAQSQSGSAGGVGSAAMAARASAIADLTAQIKALHTANLQLLGGMQQVNDAGKDDVKTKALQDQASNALSAKTAQYLSEKDLEYQASVRNNSAAKVELAGRRAAEEAQAAGITQAGVQVARSKAMAAEREQIAIEERRREEGLARESAAQDKIIAKGFSDTLADRLRAVDETYDQIEQRLKDLTARGDTHVEGKSIAEYQAELQAQKQQAEQLATMQYYEQEIAKLESERKDVYADINERVKDGNMTALEGYRAATKANDELAGKIRTLATAAKQFGEELQKAHPGAAVSKFVADAQGALDRSSNKGGSGPATTPDSTETKSLGADAMEAANNVVKERNDLEKAYQELVTKGLMTQTQADTALKKVYEETNSELKAAIEQAQKFVAAMRAAGGDNPQLQLLDAQLQKIKSDLPFVSKETEEWNKSLKQAFESSAGNLFTNLEKALGSILDKGGKLSDVFKKAGLAVLQFGEQFVQAIAQIIIKKEAEAAIDAILASFGDFGGVGGGGGFSGAGAAPTGGSWHSGGIIGPGGGNTRRGVNPAWFANAPRYHAGTVVGLAPDEQAAIVQNGEEILSKDNPRNALNGGNKGGTSGPALNIRHVLVLDPDMIPQAMQGTKGETVTMSHIKANLPTIRTLLNVTSRRQ